MSDNAPAKPGTACLGCRRRKLKCSREPEGCSHCLKSDLPCVYPTPETGVKRKRGPYKKDKPPRERHLEDLVRYLEPKVSLHEGHSRSASVDAGANADGSVKDDDQTDPSASNSLNDASRSFGLSSGTGEKSSNPEDLVKDALIALTKSSVSEREPIADASPAVTFAATQAPSEMGSLGVHPPIKRIFEYWNLYVSRVDPLLKVIHCPTVAKVIAAAVGNLQNVGPVTETLMFSIYYAAISSCTDRETRRKFGETREVLQRRYGRVIESALADNYNMPVLESIQALVIYVVVIRREDSGTNFRALFSLAVRMAQLIGLQEDPDEAFLPYEAEMRRRVWWQLCGMESRGAEEGGARASSIMEDRSVKIPLNLLDLDLDPESIERVRPRSGVTDMFFFLIRSELMKCMGELFTLSKNHRSGAIDGDIMKLKKQKLHDFARKLESTYMRHLDESRPYDWLCRGFAVAAFVKMRLVVEHPTSTLPTKDMSAAERRDLLQSAVDVIRLTHGAWSDRRADRWHWFFRDWVQWHSVAIVIAQLGYSTSKEFTASAWAVLDPILSNWDKIYLKRRDEPAWDHVNSLIERAREMRAQNQTNDMPAKQAEKPTQPQPSAFNLLAPQSMLPINSPNSMVLQSRFTDPAVDNMQQPQPTQWNPQQFPTPSSTDVPFLTGCAPALTGFEGEYGSFDGMDFNNIDFSAFDAVFGDTSWQYSSPSTDFAMDNADYTGR